MGKVRRQRGSYSDSMETEQEAFSRDDVEKYFGCEVKLKYYAMDRRRVDDQITFIVLGDAAPGHATPVGFFCVTEDEAEGNLEFHVLRGDS